MAAKTIKIALGDINIDQRLRVRDIDAHKVAVFRDALSLKKNLGALLIDQENVLVDGHHRYTALMKTFDPDYLVSAKQQEFADEKSRLVAAGAVNQEHGFRLTPFEEKRLAFRLKTEGASEEEVSKAIGRPVSKIIRWHNDAILVIGPDNKREPRARKGCVDKAIKTMTEPQYNVMEKQYVGVPIAFQADQILKHIANDTINYEDDHVIQKLHELVENVTRALKEAGVWKAA